MKEPANNSMHLRIRRRSIVSIVSILVISIVALTVLFFLPDKSTNKSDTDSGSNDPNVLTVDSDWLAQNLYQCSTYKDNEDGTWSVTLLSVEPAGNLTFEELKTKFYETPYTDYNSYHLADGVNCQGMTCYIVDWCKSNHHPYSVEYSTYHTAAIVDYNGTSYKFDFTTKPNIEVVN